MGDQNTSPDTQNHQLRSSAGSHESIACHLSPLVSPQHEHSDSLVTIRLSDTHSGNVQQPDDLEEHQGNAASESRVCHSDTRLHEGGPSLVPVDHAAVSGAVEASEVKSTIPSRVSRVRFDTEELDNIKEGLDSLEERDSTAQHSEQTSRSSKLSSNASLVDSAIDDSDSLDSHLEQFAFKKRSQSSGSLSSDSTHVDWAELEKNEEQEQRDEGTDEV